MAGYSPPVWRAYNASAAVSGAPVAKAHADSWVAFKAWWGGAGAITGRVYYEGAPGARVVLLMDQKTNFIIGKVLSAAEDGRYAFENLDTTLTARVISIDSAGKYGPLIIGDLIPRA